MSSGMWPRYAQSLVEDRFDDRREAPTTRPLEKNLLKHGFGNLKNALHASKVPALHNIPL